MTAAVKKQPSVLPRTPDTINGRYSMKKRILFIAMVLAVATVFSLTGATAAAAAETYEVSGWRTTIAFDKGDEQSLRLYTEFGRAPWLMDGKLYCWTLAEQKVIYKTQKYDDVDVSVDISTINPSGKFDSGIYVHANNVSGNLDGATAWNVNLERGADKTTYYLKLHRFENGRYVGAPVEQSGLKLPMNTVHLRVVVKSGMLYAFVNYEKTPRLTYEIGREEGYVGLRNFYSPNYFDNLSIVGEGNARDTALDELLDRAKSVDTATLTADSLHELTQAIAAADEADNQYRAEEAEKRLKNAMDNLVTRQSYETLSALVSEAKQLTNDGGERYTANSWTTLQKVIARCEMLDETSSEQEISYWANRLQIKISDLIVYGGGKL